MKLISDILDLSKIEAGTLEFNDVEFDVNQMCQEIVRSLSLKVLDKPVELRFGDHLPECRLVGDKTRITYKTEKSVPPACGEKSPAAHHFAYIYPVRPCTHFRCLDDPLRLICASA